MNYLQSFYRINWYDQQDLNHFNSTSKLSNADIINFITRRASVIYLNMWSQILWTSYSGHNTLNHFPDLIIWCSDYRYPVSLQFKKFSILERWHEVCSRDLIYIIWYLLNLSILCVIYFLKVQNKVVMYTMQFADYRCFYMGLSNDLSGETNYYGLNIYIWHSFSFMEVVLMRHFK